MRVGNNEQDPKDQKSRDSVYFSLELVFFSLKKLYKWHFSHQESNLESAMDSDYFSVALPTNTNPVDDSSLSQAAVSTQASLSPGVKGSKRAPSSGHLDGTSRGQEVGDVSNQRDGAVDSEALADAVAKQHEVIYYIDCVFTGVTPSPSRIIWSPDYGICTEIGICFLSPLKWGMSIMGKTLGSIRYRRSSILCLRSVFGGGVKRNSDFTIFTVKCVSSKHFSCNTIEKMSVINRW